LIDRRSILLVDEINFVIAAMDVIAIRTVVQFCIIDASISFFPLRVSYR
jgi:hypothetical protein